MLLDISVMSHFGLRPDAEKLPGAALGRGEAKTKRQTLHSGVFILVSFLTEFVFTVWVFRRSMAVLIFNPTAAAAQFHQKMRRQTGTSEQRNSSSLPTTSSSTQITFICYLALSMTNPPLVQSFASLALWEFLVRRRQVLPRASQGGVRCPLNKLPMPPSKDPRSVPVSAPTGCCLPGIHLKISLATIKFLVKGLHVEGVRQSEDLWGSRDWNKMRSSWVCALLSMESPAHERRRWHPAARSLECSSEKWENKEW